MSQIPEQNRPDNRGELLCMCYTPTPTHRPNPPLTYSRKIAFAAQINKTIVITARGAIRVDAWEIKDIKHRREGCSE